MAEDKEDKNISPWTGGDDQQSWQPSRIEDNSAQKANQPGEEAGSDTDETSSQDVPAQTAGNAVPDQPVTPSPADSSYKPAPLYGAYADSFPDQSSTMPISTQPQPTQPIQSQQPQPNLASGYGYGSQGSGTPQQGIPVGDIGRGQGFQPPVGNRPNQPYTAQLSKGQSHSILTAVIAAVVTAVLMLALGWAAITNGWITIPGSSSLSTVNSNSSGSGSAKVEAGKAPDWQAVAKQVSDSVVSIQVQVKDGVGAGSGAILDTEGHVVTNNHVVSGAEKIQVTLSNGQLYTAEVVGTDSTADLAVIKLEDTAKDLKPVQFADSDKLAVGEDVMAIGNPLGYDNTATTGIVSALNRPVTVMDESGDSPIVTNAVQLDAAINPGNSGGPTFNAAGQVVGINSSIASTATSKSQAGSIGIGFAIPSNLAKRVAAEIIKDGKVKHVALGITIQNGNAEADGVTRGGAKVVKVSPGTPAQKAGIKANDTIVAFNGHAVNNNYSLLGFVRAAEFGSQAKITVVRDGKTLDLDVNMNQEEQAVSGTPKSDPNGRRKRQGSNNNPGNNGDSNGNPDNGSGNGFFDPFDFFFGQ
ncbi:S1C family serine protease [Bombiscardovia coagulans]|uniref:Peptidase n=1 Tax=Bombiscardovia coagulans TaxID=686666 RepID=A0A261EQC0_9BIFI|nr:trypsin-like peptidase domain-containing protein [Bombiscardovia coagulans]OZG49052.1 peptidase [Bombiscardovia coagulans]